MSNELHHSTVELASCCLQLRDDLSFSLQRYKDSDCYVIEDDLNSTFFRVGLAEYHFISLLDGTTTVSEAIAQTASSMGDEALGEHDAIAICHWLVQSGIASTEVTRSAERLYDSHQESSQRKSQAMFSLLTPKVPLFSPDRFLTVLTPIVGWLFSRPVFLIWMVTILVAAFQVLGNWDDLNSSAFAVFDRNNWIYLGLTWVALKLVHELAHGVMCKKYGGEVRQAGLVFILLIPLPFVDVTSIWKFDSKWKRMYVAAAGMYVEIFFAAVAAIFWASMGPCLLKQVLFNVMLAGSLTTVLFNANPLMRFDGYYLLSDGLELPNLATHGQQWIRWFGKKFYLGEKVQQPTWPEGRALVVSLYAILALAWRILICVALILAAESLLFGLGIVMAAIAFAIWVVWPVMKLLRYVFVGSKTQQKPSAIRFSTISFAIGMMCWAVLNYVPWHSRIEAPAVVDFNEIHEVRTPVGGFVRKIFVSPGEQVRQGQVLIRLENRELENEVKNLKLEIEISRVRSSKYRDAEMMTSYQVERENENSLLARLNERTQQLNQLKIKSPKDGELIATDLQSLQGSYLSAGYALCSIGDQDCKEIQTLIAQSEYEDFRNRTNSQIDVHVWGQGIGHFRAKLKQVVPKARLPLPHPAFSSTVGGPLAVRFVSSQRGGEENHQSLELLEPRFLGRLELEEHDSNRLHPGQLAMVSFRASNGTVGSAAYDFLYRWFNQQRKRIREVE